MKIIITGGTGLLGQALISELVKAEHHITVLSRNPQKAQAQAAPSITYREWDAKTASGWGEAADGADAIINLAGESIGGSSFLPDRWSEAKKQRIRQSRVNAGQAVVEAVKAAAQKPKVVIQASAVGYYGPQDDRQLTESSPPGNDFLASVCVDWEQSTAAVEAAGVRRVVARIGLVQTPEGGPLPRLLLPYRLFAGGPFGSGRQWWSWVHIADVVGALHFALENESVRGAVNVTAPNPLTNRDFGKALGRALKRPSLIPVPGFAMKLLLGEVATIVLDGQRVLPEKLQQSGYAFQFEEAEAALHNLLS